MELVGSAPPTGIDAVVESVKLKSKASRAATKVTKKGTRSASASAKTSRSMDDSEERARSQCTAADVQDQDQVQDT